MKGLLLLLFALGACATSAPSAPEEAASVRAVQTAEAERARKETELAEAQRAVDADPENEEHLIWLGRRLAYLDRFDEAQAAYTRGLELHPTSYKLLRHRGHRWITLRQFDRAAEDLAQAWELCRGLPDEVEPDGQPNARNLPIGSYASNIIYHWALALYLRGDFNGAAAVWEQGRTVSAQNDDRLCSSSYWEYLALTRAGLDERARLALDRAREPLAVIENESYRQLCRLFRGETGPEEMMGGSAPGTIEFATRGYGLACWHRFRGEPTAAKQLLERVVAAGPHNAFGVIAAEVDLKR